MSIENGVTETKAEAGVRHKGPRTWPDVGHMGQAKVKPIVEGRDWTEYARSAGSGLKIVSERKKGRS